jgi:CARDB
MAGVLAAAVVLVLLLGAGADASPVRPDLVVTHVSVVGQLGSLRVTDVVLNRGTASAPRATGSYGLGRVRLGAYSIKALRPGSRARTSKTLTIPRSLAPGSYRLRACADSSGRIRETNERNNCRLAPQPVTVGDRSPPRFAGLERATTCIPGPAGGPRRESRYSLQWEPAADDRTPASRLVYDIYQATAPGAEDLSLPTYTSPPGATSFATPLLPDDAAYYFVVRARDAAGNRDANSVERLGTNLCV